MCVCIDAAGMPIWRWRHDWSPLPEWLSKILTDLLQAKVAEACAARQEFGLFSPGGAQATSQAIGLLRWAVP
jgi:hypothetical protein